MHHPAFPTPPTDLDRHVDEALDLAPQVAPLAGGRVRVPAVLAPLAAEDAALGGVGGDGDAADQGQALGLVEPGAPPPAGGEELAQEGGVDDADDGDAPDEEGDGDAEHGEQVGVVDGAVEGVDAPGGVVRGDEVVLGGAGRVGLLADESMCARRVVVSSACPPYGGTLMQRFHRTCGLDISWLSSCE